jgi:hypothetical protein
VSTLLPGSVAVFFLLMGLLALAAPERITVVFGQPKLTPAGRNEVRAVYGGFGVAMAIVLGVALDDPSLRPGVFLCAAVALAGMAGGRIVAALVERPGGFYPAWFYCVVETLMAVALFTSRGSV